MAVLKDVECRRCGTESEAMVDAEKSNPILECAKCDAKTTHRTLIRGGVKVITWGIEGVDVNDFIRYEGLKAGIPRPQDIGTPDEAKNATPVEDKAGGAIDQRRTFMADGLAERRDKRDHARKRQKYGPRVQVG